MRILVLSDIHANLTALEAVLEDAGAVDATWCLGDIIGYGPDPNECVARIRMQQDLVCLLGNHDSAALSRIPIETFNQDARRSIEWMQNVLTKESYTFLARLPERMVMARSPWSMAARATRSGNTSSTCTMPPRTWSISTRRSAWWAIPTCPSLTFPSTEQRDLRWTVPPEGECIEIHTRAILNPGSVGQPRDHDPRASYAIFYPEKNGWEIHRVEYDIRSVQKRIRAADLPMRHALRLIEGW